MAPRHQHTFTLVPNPVGGMQGLMSRNANNNNAPQSSKPPMTSKQAQKLYREATRAPRLSRAEQRRLEREEQDRIRRELDKDKAANRARALREKKRDKERLAMEEKRRRGLPLVDARPSQDTIARFLRGNGMGRKRDAVGDKVGGLPTVREETQDDGSVNGDGKDENVPAGQIAGAGESKRRRLDNGLQHGNHTAIKAVARPGERDRIAEEQGKKNHSPKSSPKGVDISVKAVELPDGRDVAEELRAPEPAQDQAKENPTSAKTNPRDKSRPEEKKEPEGKTTPAEKTRAEEPVDAKMNTQEKPKPEEKKGPETKMTPAERTRVEGTELGAVDSRLRPAGNTAQVNASKASEALGKGTPTNPPDVPPVRQPTPAHSVPGQIKAQVATSKPLAKGLAQSPMPKIPLNKQAQRPNPPRSVTTPQQQRPSKPAPAQQPPALKALQETTNSSNRIRPVPGTDSASKFASPYKPALATPQRHTSTTAPAFKQPRPQTPAGGLRKPQFRPPHLRSAAARQRPASPAPATKPRSRSHDDFLSAPPTSTQLFVMSHIDDDDLFPSPTQEARELRGDAPPAVAGPPKPSHTPSRMPAPVAGFATKSAVRPRPLTRQVARVTTPMAPPARPAVVKPATGKPVTAEPATVTKPNEAFEIPFISTQDLFLSSQDLRDVEEPIRTPSKIGGTGGNNKPPPFKPRPAVQQRPSPLSRSLPPKPAQPMTPQSRTKPPALSGKQPPIPTNVARPPPAWGKEGHCPEQTSVPKNQQIAENNSVLPPCPNNPKGDDRPPSAGSLCAPSPEKQRFFSPSGMWAEVQLALNRSRKSFDEEEKRRFAERRGQKGGNDSAGSGQSPAQEKEHMRDKSPETAVGAARGSLHHHHTPSLPQKLQAAKSLTESTHQKAAAAGDEPTVADTAQASQETDYGDPELDSVDFDDFIMTTN